MKKIFPYRYRVLVLLFFLIFVTYIDRVCISLVGVRIKAAFHLSNEKFGWVLGAFALAYAIFELPAGMLGDRIGQRAVLIRIVLWWSFFTALTGAVTGLGTLIITRFLFGMGEAGAYPNGCATIAHWVPARETSRSMSSLTLGLNAGAAIAPLIVIPLAVNFGWRAPFFVNGAIGVLWVLVCWSWFRNEPAQMRGITPEEKGMIERERCPIGHEQVFPWKVVLRTPRIWAMLAAFFCSQWGLYFYVAWMPVYLQQGRHLSENTMKTAASSLFIPGIAGALLSGILADRVVKKKGLRFGRRLFGFIALGMPGLCFFLAATVSGGTAAVLSLATGYFFFSFFANTAFSACVDIAGARSGTMAGLMNFAGQTGAFFLAIAFGKIADATKSYQAPLFVIGGMLVTGALCWLTIDPTRKIVN